MLKVDAVIDNSEQDSSAVVGLVDTKLQSIERLGPGCIGTGNLSCLVGECTHMLRHADSTYTVKGSHVEEFIDGDVGRHETFIEFALHFDAQSFERSHVLVVVEADEGRDVGASVDGVGRSDEASTVVTLHNGQIFTLATGCQTRRGFW